MPCYSEPPSQMEIACARLRELCNEIDGKKFDHEHYGSVYDGRSDKVLQEYTRKLCTWCKAHPEKVKSMSLELQIWWRDHQKEDARHERERLERQRKKALKESALSKLSSAERRALGI